MSVYVSVTQSGKDSVLFKAADIYTATVGKDGKLIAGLTNATVTLVTTTSRPGNVVSSSWNTSDCVLSGPIS